MTAARIGYLGQFLPVMAGKIMENPQMIDDFPPKNLHNLVLSGISQLAMFGDTIVAIGGGRILTPSRPTLLDGEYHENPRECSDPKTHYLQISEVII